MNRRQLASATVNSFMQLPPEDQRVLLEVLRRVVAGVPLEHALEQVIGERDVPAAWLNS